MGFLFLTFILLPIAEVMLLVKVGGAIGVMNTLMLLLVMGILGVGLARNQGRTLLLQVQAQMARGEVPTGSPLHGLLIVAGGILMVIPGFITDAIGLLLVLPGSRHLVARLLQRHFARQMRMGRVQVFTSGVGTGGGFSGGFRSGGPFDSFGYGSRDRTQDQGSGERDVTPKIIDVTPIRSNQSDDPDDNRTEG